MLVLTSSRDVLSVGRIQGYFIWVVRKDTEVVDVEASLEQDPIMRIDAGQLKLPMRDGYMPTPTLPVTGREFSIIEIEAPEDVVTDGFLNVI